MAETTVQGDGQIVDGNIFIYPKEQDLTPDDITAFIDANDSLISRIYKPAQDLYLGDHNILRDGKRDHGPDNRLVANLAHYIVDTYTGFYIGVPPKITLDNTGDNKALQQWNDENSLQDKLSEIAKQAAIFGRAIAFLYQDEDSKTRVAYSSPITSFMVYDDTVAREPKAFVNYWKDEDGQRGGRVYTADASYGLDMLDGAPNQFDDVPAVEFFMNTERQGIFENVHTLIEALDAAISQKANQNEYFDNAYLVLQGVQLGENDDGSPQLDLDGHQIIYAPSAESPSAKIQFLQKPDGDTIQEHLIDRLVSLIYQISMVANLNDEAFAGNSSGVALQYKLLPMRNLAASQDRKFTQALRQLYRLVFSIGTVLPKGSKDAWSELKFKFARNLPANLADEAETAVKLEGVVSKETQLSTLTIVDDAKAEIKRLDTEKAADMKLAQAHSVSATDQDKADSTAEQGDEDGKPDTSAESEE